MAKFIHYNPNPLEKRTGDCVIRALTKLLDMDWDTVFIDLFTKSLSFFPVEGLDGRLGSSILLKLIRR